VAAKEAHLSRIQDAVSVITLLKQQATARFNEDSAWNLMMFGQAYSSFSRSAAADI
jgi:hypothetical protein